MRRLSPAVLLLGVLCACDSDMHLAYADPRPDSLFGQWIGLAEITTQENLGSGPTLGPRGFSFPIALTFFRDHTFRLHTVNFPALYHDENSRICEGVYSRTSLNIEFFADRACRALPLTKFQVGRVLPSGITLQASTANVPMYTPASIRVHLRLDRE
jgi:hypothetical protein